jgi:hypothetical protein
MDLDRVSISNICVCYFLWCGQDDVYTTLHLNEQRAYSSTTVYNDLEVDGINTLPSYMFL